MGNHRKSKYFIVEAAFNQRKDAERLLIVGLLLLFFVMTFKNMSLDPLMKKLDGIHKKATAIKTQTSQYHTELAQVLKGQQIDRLKPLRIKKADFKKDIHDINDEIEKILKGAVSAEQMRYVLVSVLQGFPSLKMVSLARVEDEVLSPNSPKEKETEKGKDKGHKTEEHAESAGSGFYYYKHGMHIQFEGDYPTTIAYLKKLESLSYKLIWGDFSYTVTTYPKAMVDITVMTINDKKGWVGV